MSLINILEDIDEEAKILDDKPIGQKLWMPKRVIFTPEAFNEPYGQKIFERVSKLNLKLEV